MKKYTSFWWFIFFLVFNVSGFRYDANGQVEGKWTGTVRFNETTILTGGITGKTVRTLSVTIVDNRATGLYSEESDGRIGNIPMCHNSCSGSGEAELHAVNINKDAGTYMIEVISPYYICTPSGEKCDQPPTKPNQFSAVTYDRPLRGNPNVLAGSETREYELPGGMGHGTAIMTWSLARSTDIEFIITPADYDNWMPKPGRNEFTKGSVINISLKLFGKNGQPPLLKAKSFELRLSNTSKEPGYTLNAPLVPINPFPDLGFLTQANALISEEFQFVKINCNNCVSGDISIGAFDGGGFTTLTAEAILEDNSRVEGHLLISGGRTDILIPKRKDGSKIATKWFVDNREPGDMDDKETSAGNTNNGDGLTAYEEYRGVMSEGKFKRLDPNEKELGAWVKRADFALFSEGLSWFENASGLKVIPFYENEIGKDKRLNKNASSAHIYDQYVLKLVKGIIGKKGVVGKTFGGPEIPKNIEVIKIDYDKMAQQQVETELSARNANVQLPFTLKDLLAKNVSHELAHGVNVCHHGESEIPDNVITIQKDPRIRIFSPYGRNEFTDRPYPIEGIRGETESHNQGSGDVYCIMNYSPSFDWAFREDNINNSLTFYRVPLLPVGNIMCNSKAGSEYNATPNYFGEAKKGNCLSLIKLKD